MLDIIVPHYKEPFEVGKPLLDMIGLQRGMDFDLIRVLIVNDGVEHHIPDELLKDYHYQIEQIDIEHGGVSKARNAGIDHSTATWVMFFDFDDTLSNVYALRDILHVLPADNYDLLRTKLIAEDFMGENDLLRIAPEETNFVFTHGKCYRREWLNEHGIRFDESMGFQEDSLFNAYIIALLPYKRIGEIKTVLPPCVWCRRPGSVTTAKGHEDPACWGHFIRNWKLCDFYAEHLTDDRLADLVVRVAFDTYYMVKSRNITDGMRLKVIQNFQDFWEIYGRFYHRPDEETLTKIAQISWGELEEADTTPKVDFETVTNWTKIISRKLGE